MKKYFIETSAVVGYLRQDTSAVDMVDSLHGELSSSYIVLSELYEGVNRSKNAKREEEGVLNFFSGMNIVYGVDLEIARQFGEIRADLRKKGRMIEDIDIFLAATCAVSGLVMVTLNKKHFERVKDLKIFSI